MLQTGTQCWNILGRNFATDIILPSRNTRSNQPKKLSKCTGILLDKVSSGQVGLAQFLYCGLYYF